MNTQRPEWNDANNALVGYGLSMVTLCYLRRYLHFLKDLLGEEPGTAALSVEVATWLEETAACLTRIAASLTPERCSNAERKTWLSELGRAASRYRDGIYRDALAGATTEVPLQSIAAMLDDATVLADHNIRVNQRDDRLYHAYNLLNQGSDGLGVDNLYPMLEGQVAVLSSGALAAEEAADVVDALFESDIFRADQESFMLYPDRPLPHFLDKNTIPAHAVNELSIAADMLEQGDTRLIERDPDGNYRFNADFINVDVLNERLDRIAGEFGEEFSDTRAALVALYEDVFDHRSFTGRSGGMFGFEGLGCIYWHMVSKLLLAVQENFYLALDGDADPASVQRLGELYYRVRAGIGFNKTPAEYGAFPTDPYSHTPKHAGAKQPGMTGQVKEEVLTRFGELGIRVRDGAVRFDPRLLRACEFSLQSTRFRYLGVNDEWQELAIPPRALAFTWCRVPISYEIRAGSEPTMAVTWRDGKEQTLPTPAMNESRSSELFRRSGRIQKISIYVDADHLFKH